MIKKILGLNNDLKRADAYEYIKHLPRKILPFAFSL